MLPCGDCSTPPVNVSIDVALTRLSGKSEDFPVVEQLLSVEFEDPVNVVLTRMGGTHVQEGSGNVGLLRRFPTCVGCSETGCPAPWAKKLPPAVPRSDLVVCTREHWTISIVWNLSCAGVRNFQKCVLSKIDETVSLPETSLRITSRMS